MQTFVVLNILNIYCINFTGEGLDFKAEVVNKDVQSWMPRGVPSGEDWLRVTRNLDHLKEVSIDHVGTINMAGMKHCFNGHRTGQLTVFLIFNKTASCSDYKMNIDFKIIEGRVFVILVIKGLNIHCLPEKFMYAII